MYSQQIVERLKANGVFDQFRKQCIADVDTKPAYINFHSRVVRSAEDYLKTVHWAPGLGRLAVREGMRKHIQESSYFEKVLDGIVNQVVDPNIQTLIFPAVETAVSEFLEEIRRKEHDPKENEIQFMGNPGGIFGGRDEQVETKLSKVFDQGTFQETGPEVEGERVGFGILSQVLTESDEELEELEELESPAYEVIGLTSPIRPLPGSRGLSKETLLPAILALDAQEDLPENIVSEQKEPTEQEKQGIKASELGEEIPATPKKEKKEEKKKELEVRKSSSKSHRSSSSASSHRHKDSKKSGSKDTATSGSSSHSHSNHRSNGHKCSQNSSSKKDKNSDDKLQNHDRHGNKNDSSKNVSKKEAGNSKHSSSSRSSQGSSRRSSSYSKGPGSVDKAKIESSSSKDSKDHKSSSSKDSRSRSRSSKHDSRPHSSTRKHSSSRGEGDHRGSKSKSASSKDSKEKSVSEKSDKESSITEKSAQAKDEESSPMLKTNPPVQNYAESVPVILLPKVDSRIQKKAEALPVLQLPTEGILDSSGNLLEQISPDVNEAGLFLILSQFKDSSAKSELISIPTTQHRSESKEDSISGDKSRSRSYSPTIPCVSEAHPSYPKRAGKEPSKDQSQAELLSSLQNLTQTASFQERRKFLYEILDPLYDERDTQVSPQKTPAPPTVTLNLNRSNVSDSMISWLRKEGASVYPSASRVDAEQKLGKSSNPF